MKEYGKPKEDFQEERERLLNLLDLPENKDIIMRLIGALAFNIRCPNYNYIQLRMGRVFTDIDFASYSKFTRKIIEFLTACGYEEDIQVTQLFGESRLLFHDFDNERHIDVFLDRLSFSHTIDLRGRLEKDRVTVPLAELFLEKMQIVQINEKDLIDTIMLLREYDFGNSDENQINLKIILKTLSRDWGFWKTVTNNLLTLKDYVSKAQNLSNEDIEIVNQRINKILNEINNSPKSLRWKIRSIFGEKIKWYQDVEELTDRM